MSWNTAGWIVLVGCLSLDAAILAAVDDERPVVNITTRDGTRLTGISLTRSLPLTTSHGRLKLPIRDLEAVEFHEESPTATVSLTNTDRVSGGIEAETIQLSTAMGQIGVPWPEVVRLSIASGDQTTDNVLYRPELSCPIRFEVVLRDGSRVLGTPEQNQAILFSPIGRLVVPWSLVRKVLFHEDRESSELQLWNGDVLNGCVDWRALSLSTGLGPLHISTVHTKKICLSLGGMDLVQQPYASITGDRYFMGAVKNTQARRIQGQLTPASQFIEAHAGGQIEFAFEQPVREFYAILTMYESYNANKGNVLFQVETEHGLRYTSPIIRNSQKHEVYLRFPPTQKLVLVTDPNGSNQEDWSVWLRPEVR